MSIYWREISPYLLGVFLTFSFCSFTCAQDQDNLPLRLICTFGEGQSTSYEDGKFLTQQAKQLTFTVFNINLEGQTAELEISSDQKTMNVRIVRAINANHFLEVVNEGFLNLTTIYDKDGSSGEYPAVHSRHFGLLGRPLFAHYTGVCKDH